MQKSLALQVWPSLVRRAGRLRNELPINRLAGVLPVLLKGPRLHAGEKKKPQATADSELGGLAITKMSAEAG